jgi:hypothetical protein
MRWICVGAVVLLSLSVLAYAVSWGGDAVSQPVQFNHSLHLKEAALECLACHANAQKGRFAGIPDASICLDCHDADGEKGQNAEKDKLFRLAEKSPDIPWRRVAISQPDVYFPHGRHVGSAQIDCLECHAGQDVLTAPPQTPTVVLTMTQCIRCHEKGETSTDCLTCHR